jgi:hypothetical protein
MRNNGNNQFEVLNKEKGEMVLFEKGAFSYKPEQEEEYFDQDLTNAVELALSPFLGLCNLILGTEDIDEGAFRDVLIPLLRDASTNLETITKYLQRSLGEISLKYGRCESFISTMPDIPIALVFKPAKHLVEQFGLAKPEAKKLRAVSGAKG